MLLKYLLPVVAVALIVTAFWSVSRRREPAQTVVTPPAQPPMTPYGNTVAGAGIVEPRLENIQIGSPVSGIVVEVLVEVGQKVAVADPLFRLDDRTQRAELKYRQALLDAAQAEVQRLEKYPRKEELPVREAAVRAAEAELVEQQYELRRVRPLAERGAVTDSELVRQEQAVEKARALLEQRQAELSLLKSGSWEQDLAVAKAKVDQAESQIEQSNTELDRLTVRALSEGQVLQVNIRPGEHVGPPFNIPLIILGDVGHLHARVDIDEYDIPRFRTDAPASAMIRGFSDVKYPLSFVRVEPYVVPKQSLTGMNTERVDTRVLQAIYRIESADERLFVGQQLDVFIEASPATKGNSAAATVARE